MFDFAWSEIAVIGLVSVLVLGPKELPQAMRTMAKVVRKMRSLTSELQGHVNDIVRDAELAELRDQVQKFSTTNVHAEVAKVVDPTGEMTAQLNAPLIEGHINDQPVVDQPVIEQPVVEQTALPLAEIQAQTESAPSALPPTETSVASTAAVAPSTTAPTAHS